MTVHALLVLALFVGCLLALAFPLGDYMARIYDGKAAITRWLAPVEGFLYRAARVDPAAEMSARAYLAAVLLFNLAGLLLVYAVLRLQAHLPLNPAALPGVLPEVAFNTAVSFASNTNWQAYAGETTLSPFSQMFALTVQNFLSAATGMAALVALVRGFARNTASGVGNFWVDLTRGTLYVLLPLSAVLALVLVSQGVVQTFDVALHAQLLEPFRAPDGSSIREQVIALGPVASQVAIKQLGTNGGGFFNANSAHPFENPTPLSNFVELLAIVLIPAALCITFGNLVGDRRQGIALLATMLLLFLPLAVVAIVAEQHGTPLLSQLTDLASSELAPGGNMEGKELRFGIVDSALWATATSAASNGSVNAMHDSFTPLGGLVPMFLIQLGEIVFGGVGSGLYGMLVYAIVAVFISGLMVGRTPEYLGKKIEAFEMKMASLVILLPAATVLLGTATACLSPSAKGGLGNSGPHGFSELLYAFSSAANNNGSAFGGLDASRPYYAIALGIAMLIGRYWVIVPVLAIAGALARKRQVPVSSGTLPTHTPLFVGLLSGTILLVGALTFVPAIALGPVVEALILSSR
jgi:K+-transporting ATPase ATPase A chain